MSKQDCYRVSVIIPTKNRSHLLAEALASVLGEATRRVRLEAIVADNGSLDDTKEIAKEFGVRHIEVSKPGAAATRNAGLRVATGEYIAFLDDDDVWLPGHLGLQLDFLSAHREFV